MHDLVNDPLDDMYYFTNSYLWAKCDIAKGIKKKGPKFFNLL